MMATVASCLLMPVRRRQACRCRKDRRANLMWAIWGLDRTHLGLLHARALREAAVTVLDGPSVSVRVSQACEARPATTAAWIRWAMMHPRWRRLST